MMHDGWYPWPADWEALTLLQKSAATHALVRQARTARSRAIGRLFLGWARYLRYRKRRRELAELAHLDDRMLRDAGLNRSDVRAAIQFGSRLGSACR